MQSLPIFLAGVFVGCSIVLLLWTRDLKKRARHDRLITNRLSAAGAALEAFAFEEETK